MNFRKSRFKAVLLYGVIALIAIISLALIWLTQPQGERYLASRLESILTTALLQPVKLGKLETNLFSRIEVSDIRVTYHDNPDLNVIAIPSLKIRYDLLSLISVGLKVDSVFISSIYIDLGRDSLGAFNFLLLNSSGKESASPKSSSRFKLSINYIELQQGDLAFNDHIIKLGGALRGFSTDVHLDNLSNIDFTSHAESFGVSIQGKSFEWGEFALAGQWSSPNLQIDHLDFSSPTLNVGSTGSIKFIKPSPVVQASVKIEGSLPAVLDSLWGTKDSLRLVSDGQFAVNTTMTGTFSEPELNADASIAELSWRQLEATDLVLKASAKRVSGTWQLDANANWEMIAPSDSLPRTASLNMSATASDSLLALNELQVQLSELQVAAKGSLHYLEHDTLLDGLLTVKGSLSAGMGIVEGFVQAGVGNISGEVDLALVAGGSINSPELHLSGTVPLLQREELTVTDLQVGCDYISGNLNLRKLEGTFCKGRFELQGGLATATLQHRLVFKAANVDLHKLMSGVYVMESPFEGYFNANLKSSGKISDPSTYIVHAQFSLDSVEYKDVSIPPFVSTIVSDSSRIAFDLKHGEARINARGTLFADSAMGDFTVHVPEVTPIAALINQNDMSGSIDLKGRVGGKYRNPKFQVDIYGTRCTYHAFPVDTIRGRVDFANKALSFQEVTFSGGLAKLDTTKLPFGLTGFSGGISYSGDLDGPLADPTINLNLKVDDFHYRSYVVQSGKLQVSTADHKIILNELKLNSDSLHISGTGDYEIAAGIGKLNLELAETSIDSIANLTKGRLDLTLSKSKKRPIVYVRGESIPIGTIAKITGQDSISGNMDLNLIVRLGESFEVDSLVLALRNITLSQARIDSLVLKGQMTDHEIVVTELNGFMGVNGFQASAKLERKGGKQPDSWFSGENQIVAAFAGDSLDLAMAQPFLPAGFVISGRSRIDLKATGRLNRPVIVGSVKLHDGYLVTGGETPLLDSLQGEVVINDTLLLINSLAGVYKGVFLSANADVRFRNLNDINLNLYLSVNQTEALHVGGELHKEALQAAITLKAFDLALIQPMIPGVDALGGIATAEIKVTGVKTHPIVTGQLAIQRMYLSPTLTPDSLLNCSLNVNIDNKEINVKEFYGELGGGTILASGRYTFVEDTIGSNLVLHIKNSRVVNTRDYKATVKQADLLVRQSAKQTLVEGDIILGDTHLRSRFTQKSLVNMFRATERPKKEQPKILQQLRLDVRIRDSEEIWIDNNLARLKLRADLALVGELTKPTVSGRISSVEGYVLYLDRKFNVEQGSLDFYDPHKINPNIELLAVTTVKSYKSMVDSVHVISLAVSGELDKAIVTLTSIPPEDMSDILSLLTLGVTRRDLTGVDGQQGDVSFQEAVRERLELVTSRRVSGYVASNVENLLGLKSFTIENNLFQFDKNWGPQLIASKQLSPRTELTYTMTVGRINEQGVKLAYKLTNHLAVEGQTDQIGRAGVDLTYKLKLP